MLKERFTNIINPANENIVRGGEKQRLKNIDFLRVIACISIIIFHLFLPHRLGNNNFLDIDLYSSLRLMSRDGLKAVELFFIISGFFFAFKLNTGFSLFEFIKRKVLRFYPVLIFVTILSFFISLTGIIKWDFYSNLFCLFGLNGTSLVYNLKGIQTAQFWYCSDVIWIGGLFFYLLKNFDKKTVNLIIALGIFFSYSFLIHAQGGKIWDIHKLYYFIFHAGLLRAFAGIGIGYFIGEWYNNNCEKIKQTIIKPSGAIIISIIEFMCIFFIVNNLLFHRVHCINKLIFVIVFAVTFVLLLCKKGIISKLLDKDIFVFLGRYTYSIYMMHILILSLATILVWDKHSCWVHVHPVLNLVFTLFSILAAGVLTYHFVEKPAAEYLNKKFPRKEAE